MQLKSSYFVNLFGNMKCFSFGIGNALALDAKV